MFERFSPASRRVVVEAEREARGHGYTFIGTEHLLLGLLRSAPETAHRFLISDDTLHICWYGL